MPALRLARFAIAAAAALTLALPAPALASSTLQSSMLDDSQLIYASPNHVLNEMRQIKALGVDQVKVSVVWNLIAPNSMSASRPAFNATDPGAYPLGVWTRYDRVVQDAQQLGLQVYFMIVPPAPLWAIPRGEPLGQGEPLGHAPNPSDFGQFVQALGERYSGSYEGLPRVTFWGIWNEPDISAWLNPWHRGSEYLEPLLYRGLLNAAWNGLQASGHTPATDTILIGELANSGSLSTLQFVRALYCVGSNLRPLSGGAAAHFGCPASGSSAAFVAANPLLFGTGGFAHHPYSFNEPPNRPYSLSNWITMHNLSLLERELDGIFSGYGKLPSGGVPLYLTEFGYESNPPNPFVLNSTAQQAAWINESEYMAWRYPYVRSLNQFELIDSPPRKGTKPGSKAYWSTFQTGLEFASGRPKPALAAFRLPIWLPFAHHGSSVSIWGQLRPADHTQPQYGVIQFAPAGSRSFQTLDVLQTLNPEGFFLIQVAIPSSGSVRLAWLSPGGVVYYSRSVAVS
jgi:hypothetical protein